jgi:hypothetical protein
MRLTLRLTLDGLVRALRTRAHDLADDVAGLSRRPGKVTQEADAPRRRPDHAIERSDDDRRRT